MWVVALGGTFAFIVVNLLGPTLALWHSGHPTLDIAPGFEALANLAREKLRLRPERIAIIKSKGSHSHSRGSALLRCAVHLTETDDTPARRNGVIAHELAHLARGDPFRALLGDSLFSWLYVACLVPAFWMLTRQELKVYKFALSTLGFSEGLLVKDAGVPFHLLASVIGLGMLTLLVGWQQHLHQRAEYLADKQAVLLLNDADAMQKALPLDDGTRTFPFSSHPPSENRRRAIPGGQFSTSVESRLHFVGLIWASCTFFFSALLAVTLSTQVGTIRGQLEQIEAGVTAEKTGFASVTRLRRSLEQGLTKAHGNLGLELPDGGVQPDGGLAVLHSKALLLTDGLHRSGKPLIDGLDRSRGELGIQKTGDLGDSGLVPSLKTDLKEFEESLALARSESGLGLPTPDGGFPAGGVLERVVDAAEHTRQQIAAAPAYLGLEGAGGTADAGPIQRVAQSAQRLSGSLDRAQQALDRLQLTRDAGAATRCDVGALTLDKLEGMSLEERLDCIDRMSTRLAQLQLQRLRAEEQRAKAAPKPEGGTGEAGAPPVGVKVDPEPPDGGTGEAGGASTGAQPAPDGG